MVTTTQAVGMGVILIFVAVAFPAFISGAQTGGTTETTATITDGVNDSVDVANVLVATLTDKSESTASMTLTSAQTGDSADVTLTEGETAEITLDNETVTVTLLTVEGGQAGDVTVRAIYPSDFGWGSGAKTLTDQLPLVFAALALVIVLGMVGVARS